MSETMRDSEELDRRIVIATQGGLPLVPRPYAALAEQLGISEPVIQQRLQSMLDDGRIRRIGVVPNHYKLGYTANGMSVWDIDDEFVDALGEQVGALASVSHCYRRPRYLPQWPYNLFAMVHGHSRDEVMAEVDSIATLLDSKVRSHDVLFSTRILKKTGLRIGSTGT